MDYDITPNHAYRSSLLYKDEGEAVNDMLEGFAWETGRAKRIHNYAVTLIEKARKTKRKAAELESFLKEYSLDTEEGLALMCLAEALLRIPDRKTAIALIKDKSMAASWMSQNTGKASKDWVVKAAGLGMVLTTKSLDSVMSRMAEPVIHEAMLKAMRMLGTQFVLGSDVVDAVNNAKPHSAKGYRLSYDMLGEGARTIGAAEHYFESYDQALDWLIDQKPPAEGALKDGISVKLSALHPRFEFAQRETSVPYITERVKTLCMKASAHDIPLTIDAEESERLEMTLDIIQSVMEDKTFGDWRHFGVAVQAYQKRSLAVIDQLVAWSEQYERPLQIRLVKGAYWDREIKHAQVHGFEGFPVYTRKAATDVSYLVCAQKMIEAGRNIYPMFATHNAHSIAAIMHMVKDHRGPDEFEFQRLHGMGVALFDHMVVNEGVRASIYAPVGPHEDLLPYLVRRLLENGANSSFVNKLLDDEVDPVDLAADPVAKVNEYAQKSHPQIALPANMFGASRKNSDGVDLHDAPRVEALLGDVYKYQKSYVAAPYINGKLIPRRSEDTLYSPAYTEHVTGRVSWAHPRHIDEAFEAAKDGFKALNDMPSSVRAEILERIADSIEANAPELIALCIYEAGKTVEDALGEIREAVDFCRYYAVQGRKNFPEDGQVMYGPTGEHNVLYMGGRGAFVCISPWNFPLAIFTGQVVAALMAGNAVIAKPAEQTTMVALRMVEIMIEAGIPPAALSLLPGDGEVGAKIVSHPDVAGVAFTGSTGAAKSIQRALAMKDGAIVPLIAETGGQNAMIVDSSALIEQVIDDVIKSAFGAAGQRCSALRVLYVQDDIADDFINMLQGAMKEIQVGHPAELSSDIGPVIDEEAHAMLTAHRTNLEGFGHKIYECNIHEDLDKNGYYFAPCAFEIDSMNDLEHEIFGPILHVVRFKGKAIEDVIDEINNSGFGLTFGVHSRIDSLQERLRRDVHAGNVYVNRSMIGAVVGSQPFGGCGLSGTGPKAGGPHYLLAFAHEKSISIDTTAAGGNASLVSLEE